MPKTAHAIFIISFVISLVLTTILIVPKNAIKYSYSGQPNEQDYEYLKNISTAVAKSGNTNVTKDENIDAQAFLTQDSLIVEVKNKLWSITAVYPATIKTTITGGNTYSNTVQLDYQNAVYTENSEILPIWFYVILLIVLVFLLTFFLILLFTPFYFLMGNLITKLKKRQ